MFLTICRNVKYIRSLLYISRHCQQGADISNYTNYSSHSSCIFLQIGDLNQHESQRSQGEGMVRGGCKAMLNAVISWEVKWPVNVEWTS